MLAIIDTNTPISMGVLIATFPLLVSLIGVWFKLKGLEKKISVFWTVPNQKIFCERLQHKNPDMKVPSVHEVLETFTTNGKE